MTPFVIIQIHIIHMIRKAILDYKRMPKEQLSLSYIETRLKILERQWKKYNDNHTNIIISCTKEHLEKYLNNDIYEETEEMYIKFKCELKAALARIIQSNPALRRGGQVRQQDYIIVDLPLLSIPNFSGKHSEWLTFRDMFLSVIHDNNALDDLHKLFYLKSHLVGEAEWLTRDIPIIGNNYQICWNRLDDRYNNKKYLVSCYLKGLFLQKHLPNETPCGLKDLVYITDMCLVGLKNLGIDTSSWDVIIVHLIGSKLDRESKKLWKAKRGAMSEPPTYDQFTEFIQNRYTSLKLFRMKMLTPSSCSDDKALNISDNNCAFCDEAHTIWSCEKFTYLDVKARRKFVKSLRIKSSKDLHHKGLGSEHAASNFRLLDRILQDPMNNLSQPTDADQFDEEEPLIIESYPNVNEYVLMATALVLAEAKDGTLMSLKCVLDQGSQISFITEDAVHLLGLKKYVIHKWVSGMGSGLGRLKSLVYLKIQSRYDPRYILDIKAHVLNKTALFQPQRHISMKPFSGLTNKDLADPTFNVPCKAELLLGAEVLGHILEEGFIKGPPGFPIAQKTKLGWILSGTINHDSADSSSHSDVINSHTNLGVNLFYSTSFDLHPEIFDEPLKPEETRCDEVHFPTIRRKPSDKS